MARLSILPVNCLVQTETERHPHPITEAIRWQIREERSSRP